MDRQTARDFDQQGLDLYGAYAHGLTTAMKPRKNFQLHVV
jgi:hypothetical protein